MDERGKRMDTVSRMDLSGFSLQEPGFHESPNEYYRALREHAPVFRSERDRCYLLSRYHDVKNLLHDYELYNPRQGSMQTKEIQDDSLDFDPIFLQSPPEHTRLRKLAGKAYSIASASRMELSASAIARSILEEIPAATDHFEVIADYADPLAVRSVMKFLEIPQSDYPSLQPLLVKSLDRNDQSASAQEAVRELAGYVARHFGHVKAEGVGGFAGEIVNAQIDGDRLSNGEAYGMLMMALVGGVEDLVRALANFAYSLWLYPGQREALLEDVGGRINAAISECLRLFPTTHYLRRVTTRPTTLHGTEIAAGSNVVGLLGAANRDEAVFKDADNFDMARNNASASLTFGSGPHICIGKHIARVVLKAGALELINRFPRYELDMSRASRIHNPPIIGYRRLPLRKLG
jgi:cytochrome P450